MKPGSVVVKPGDRVQPGQPVGHIGFSGDSIFPQLHYSLMDGPEVFKAWGVPAYLSQFHRVLGAISIRVKARTSEFRRFLGERRCVFRRKIGEERRPPRY
jgi:murein DD-endopeptidase MepM/ murein hydrolase activator NlpD